MKPLPVVLCLLFSAVVNAQQTPVAIHFEFNKARLTDKAKMSLDSLIAVEKDAGNRVFELNGYCDPTGTNQYNKRLSQKRVASVKSYLVKNGIPSSRMGTTMGHGEEGQLNENSTAEESQLNRRVEISFINVVRPNPPGAGAAVSLLEKIADTATKAGTTIVLKNINFYGGTPFPLPESFDVMDELLQTMKLHYNLVIEIRGHICCRPEPDDSEYQQTGNGLSEERAKMVYAHLIGHGIETNRVSYRGFGHSMPIYPYPEKTEEERVANRRVEIKIISK